jgi:hypothetical protein
MRGGLVIAFSLVAGAIAACGAAYGADDVEPKLEDAGADSMSADALSEAADASNEATGPSLPVKIGTSGSTPVLDVVVDSTRVLWMTQENSDGARGSVYACPKDGCVGSPLAVATSVNVGALASDGVTAYASFVFGDRNTARIDPGGTLTNLPVATHLYAKELAARPDGLFLLAYYEADGGSTYARTPFEWNGSVETRLGDYVPPDIMNMEQMVVTPTHIFLGSHSLPQIVACSRPSCSTWSVVTNASTSLLGSMTSDGTRIFWTDFDGQLYSCAANGLPCTPTQELGRVQLGTTHLLSATYAAGALYIEGNDGNIRTCNPAQCAASLRIIAHETALALSYATQGHTITADDSAVYWAAVDTQTADGAAATYRIMKLAK